MHHKKKTQSNFKLTKFTRKSSKSGMDEWTDRQRDGHDYIDSAVDVDQGRVGDTFFSIIHTF